MEKESSGDNKVKVSIVMNRSAMTPAEQAEFLADLAEIMGCMPEDITAPVFTTIPSPSRQP